MNREYGEDAVFGETRGGWFPLGERDSERAF
jgi:hypothetical protein